MKSVLQQRAEAAASRFREQARRPVVIEFAGLPKAGKTTAVNTIYSFLKRCGFSVKVVVERASVCPIRDKRHATFNIWTASTTLAQLLEYTQDPPKPDDPDILILDRGIFDSICWLTLMDRLSRITTADREIAERFLLVEEWRNRISGVVLMLASPSDALDREQGYLPIEGAGSIMNKEVLERMLETAKECAERLKKMFRIHTINTSAPITKSPQKSCEAAVDFVLQQVEAHLAEDILHLPKKEIVAAFAGRTFIVGDEATALLKAARSAQVFRPREEVEASDDWVQPLPVVVVRNKSGEILRLRRRERDSKNPLHEKLVIWAGGHVRREDAVNHDAIIHCVRRELGEELRLSVEPEELVFLGAVYHDVGAKTAKHIALVFEWRAPTDDVAVTLSSAEFFERRGTSLSGKFVPLADLLRELANGAEVEPWTDDILRSLLPNAGVAVPGRLF